MKKKKKISHYANIYETVTLSISFYIKFLKTEILNTDLEEKALNIFSFKMNRGETIDAVK